MAPSLSDISISQWHRSLRGSSHTGARLRKRRGRGAGEAQLCFRRGEWGGGGGAE